MSGTEDAPPDWEKSLGNLARTFPRREVPVRRVGGDARYRVEMDEGQRVAGVTLRHLKALVERCEAEGVPPDAPVLGATRLFRERDRDGTWYRITRMEV